MAEMQEIRAVDDNDLLLSDKEKYLLHLKDIIADICRDFTIDEMSPNQFTFCLSGIYSRFYRLNPSMLCTPYKQRLYDPIKVLKAVFVYVDLCNLYKLPPSVYGFSGMTHISDVALYQMTAVKFDDAELWGKGFAEGGQPQHTVNIPKILVGSNEQALTDLLLDNKVNPLKPLSILNFRHGWADNRNRVKEEQKAINADALPTFALTDNES